MANSEYEYVRQLEPKYDHLPIENWIVVRIDGRGFSKFTTKHNFTKPNDKRAIDLMNAAATEVMKQLVDIVFAYGQSDEYSFILPPTSTLFDRRGYKLATTIATTFSVEYALQWPSFFPDQPLTRPFPTFDGRCIAHPSRAILRDYLSWRQADCHINNLYNTTFWAMVQRGGQSGTEAELELKGTVSADKNEILWSRFGINYNNEPEVFKKGSVVYRDFSATEAPSTEDPASRTQADKERKKKLKAPLQIEHVDIIKDAFWEARPWILAKKPRRTNR